MRLELFLLFASFTATFAAHRRFNYGAQGNNYDSFRKQFETAKRLLVDEDVPSARLYTMIQEGTDKEIISAVRAAVETKTSLLLGLWTSGNQTYFDRELAALNSTIREYGSQGLRELVVGISVGSEDLYRASSIDLTQDGGVGQNVSVLVDYIHQVRRLVDGTVLGDVPIGHVDTLNAYLNRSNEAIIEAIDFVGLDSYPYFQNTSISKAGDSFWGSFDAMQSIASGKPVWVTETGWPISDTVRDYSTASTMNAAQYWAEVACELTYRRINFWWYILADAGASPSFGVVDLRQASTSGPYFSLQCGRTNDQTGSSTTADDIPSTTQLIPASTVTSLAGCAPSSMCNCRQEEESNEPAAITEYLSRRSMLSARRGNTYISVDSSAKASSQLDDYF